MWRNESWRLLALCLTCTAAISCKSQPHSLDAPPRRPGFGPVTPGEKEGGKVALPKAEVTQYEAPLAPQPGVPALEAPAAAPPDEPAAQPSEAEAKAPRDFSAELVKMLGSPGDCLTARVGAGVPTQIDIAVSTHVMPSGTVAQSEVTSSALSASELACVRNRVEALHFAAPIENAPFDVQGSVHLARAATPPPALPSAQPAANADGTAHQAAAALPTAPGADQAPDTNGYGTLQLVPAPMPTAPIAEQAVNANRPQY
jgi:hypothetical protein